MYLRESVSYLQWLPPSNDNELRVIEIVDKIAARLAVTSQPEQGASPSMSQGASPAVPLENMHDADAKEIDAALAVLRAGTGTRDHLRLVLQRLHGRLGLGQPDALAAGLDMYVPLRYGLRSPPLARAEPRLDLDALLHALLHGTPRDMARVGGGDPDTSSTRECRCIFAQGAAGTGKTLLGWRLAQMYDQLPRGRQASARIPIVIALPTVADAVRAAVQAAAREVDAFLVAQVLQAYDSRALDAAWQAMDAAQRAWLHETGFVFVLDGVDELVARLAIHTLLRLRAWPNSVFVVAARTGFFADDNDGLQHVCPRDGEGGLLAAQMRAIHLLPFDAAQVEMYIDGFARRHSDVHEGWDGPRYRDALQAFPQLDEFATEPLLLFMVLNVLPLVQGGGGRVRLDPVTLEVNDNVTDTDAVFPRVTRAELYALFTHAWVQREARKVNMDTRVPPRRRAVRRGAGLPHVRDGHDAVGLCSRGRRGRACCRKICA